MGLAGIQDEATYIMNYLRHQFATGNEDPRERTRGKPERRRGKSILGSYVHQRPVLKIPIRFML